MGKKDYHKLTITGDIKLFIIAVYKLTEKFPKSELYGITSQLRRASVSILLNLVEGKRYYSNKQFAKFLTIADSSCAEVEIILELCHDLKFITLTELKAIENKRKKIAGKLVALMKKVKATL